MRSHAPQPQTQITQAATIDPLIMHTSEVHQKHQTRLQCGEHPTNDRSEHNARGGHSSRQHATGGEGSSVQNRPKARPAAAAATSTQPRSASQRPRPQIQTADDAQNHSQVVVLASIDLRSQHGRLVSARVSASVRKGVQGSCNRAT